MQQIKEKRAIALAGEERLRAKKKKDLEEDERVRTQQPKKYLVEYRHMQDTRHRVELLEKED
jgi:hypothetical protein